MTTATTNALTAPIARIFSINEPFVYQALEGLSEEELWRAPTERNNAMLWVAGHLVQTRAMMVGILGEPVDTGWGKLFDRGAACTELLMFGEDDAEHLNRFGLFWHG